MKPESASGRGSTVTVATAAGADGPGARHGAPGQLILWWRRGDSSREWEPRVLFVEDGEVLSSLGRVGDGVAAAYGASQGGSGRDLRPGEAGGAVLAACRAVRAVTGYLEGLGSEETAERELLVVVRGTVSELRNRVQDLENSVLLRHGGRAGNREVISGGHDGSRAPGSEP